MRELLIPGWLLSAAVAIVWLYEGLWCKLMARSMHELDVIASMPFFGSDGFRIALKLLGVLELAIALWVMTGIAPVYCALLQSALLLGLNLNGLLFARNIIHEPVGMVVRNASFLVLVWVWALQP
jgi:hypothetical protein